MTFWWIISWWVGWWNEVSALSLFYWSQIIKSLTSRYSPAINLDISIKSGVEPSIDSAYREKQKIKKQN